MIAVPMLPSACAAVNKTDFPRASFARVASIYMSTVDACQGGRGDRRALETGGRGGSFTPVMQLTCGPVEASPCGRRSAKSGTRAMKPDRGAE